LVRHARQETAVEDTRFDAIAKALGSVTTRRLTLGALLGGALARLGLTDAEAAKSGKCKTKCGECEKCKKGKRRKKNGKKVYKKGKCQPKTNGTVCTGGSCCGGVCRDLQSDEANCGTCGTVCTANQVCQAGSCFPRSTCPAAGTGFCTFTPCGTPECFCAQSTEGNSVCVTIAGAACPPTGGSCTTDASCPPGEVCVNVGEPGCGCAAGARDCMARCPTPTAAGAAATAAEDNQSPIPKP